MKRRSFLKIVGGAGILSFSKGNLFSGNSDNNTNESNEGMFIDNELLSFRNQNRSTVVCQNGIVCSGHPLASLSGVEILKAGGNAIDAAVCANAMMSLVSPMMCGPGGDLFAIVWIEKEKRLFGLNASGRSPYNWNIDAARGLGLKNVPVSGPLSWSIPGCVSGWGALMERFGRFNMAKVLEAPIFYAREGFPLSPVIARGWSINPKEDPSLAQIFIPDGKPLHFGDIFKNHDLTRSFEIIARDGADAFYRGEIAERIVKFSQVNGGRFSMRDFRDHTISWIDPVSSNYRGYDVWELPPNGQGIVALQMLNILENFDIPSLNPNSPEYLHLFIEAKKLSFEDRAVYYADMDFADVPLKQLISEEYARQRSKLIDLRRASQKVLPGRFSDSSDTIYLTAADKEGNMVSLVQSVCWLWGSRLVPTGLGFCMQNRGTSFSLDPNDLNKLEPHKRPFNTIIPAFLTKDGKPLFSFGVMHGDYQPQGHVHILINILDFGMSPQQSGEQPRVRHAGSSEPTGSKMSGGGTVIFERHISDKVKEKLADMGHNIKSEVEVFGGYQGIWRQSNPRRYFGGSDPRKDGCAIGY